MNHPIGVRRREGRQLRRRVGMVETKRLDLVPYYRELSILFGQPTRQIDDTGVGNLDVDERLREADTVEVDGVGNLVRHVVSLHANPSMWTS